MSPIGPRGEEKLGKSTLRWQPAKDGTFNGVVNADGKRVFGPISDTDLNRLVARLRNEAGRLHPDYVGYDGAVSRFLRIFRDGLRGTESITRERAYKETASDRLKAAVPLGEALAADNDVAARIAGAKIQTNMLSRFEAARLRDTLLGKTGGAFVRGAARFASGEYHVGLTAMAAAVQEHGRVSWPLVTYLPFLWDYATQMFLKPTVTCDFADRVGHHFHHSYSADLNEETYLALLDLVSTTKAAIASLQPKDNLDIQSFIWVVGEYTEDDVLAP